MGGGSSGCNRDNNLNRDAPLPACLPGKNEGRKAAAIIPVAAAGRSRFRRASAIRDESERDPARRRKFGGEGAAERRR